MDELKNHTLGGFPMMKLKSLSLMTGTTAIMLLVGVSWAAEQPGLGIVNNDSIYIDGNSLKIVPGKGKGDASALIKKLDAHAVGAGMIIFRSGDKLYMADAPSPVIETSSGIDRYGSDRDTSVSAAQAEREWQEYLRQSRRYGSDREAGPTTAQGEREWQEYLRQNRRYGSDREAGPTTAQGERERQDWPQDRRRYYGSDREAGPTTAQGEREWQEYLRSQNRRYGSDRIVVDDPEYADYKLKKTFADNWTASEAK